jgi:polysaccharide export outer membrane protein
MKTSLRHLRISDARSLRRSSLLSLAVLSLSIGLAGCDSVDGGVDGAAKVDALPPPTPVAAQPASADADYRIGPLDVLDIAVQHVPEMTVTTRVSGSGEISLPLVGDIVATGRTAMQLQQDIATAASKYVQAPEVTVFIREYASQRITVEGEVTQPGIFPIQGKTTLLQALALAHGTTQNARLQTVAVFRVVDDKRVFNLNAIRTGKAVDPQIYGNDVIEVNTSRSKSLYHDALQAVPLIGLFRLY